MSTSVAPWRLERRDLSAPRISGRCAKIGRLGAERAVEQHLLRRVGDVVGAANHVGDAHVDVVDDDAQLIGGQAEFSSASPALAGPLPERSRTKSSISSLENSRSPKTAS